MSVKPIIAGLERSGATGADARDAARLGFLEWVFGYPGDVTARVVREALEEPEVRNADSAAAKAFVEVLEQARHAALMARGRRGRAARMVH